MTSNDRADMQLVFEPKCYLTPQPSLSPSLNGMEHDLKDLALAADESTLAKYPPSLDTDSTLSANTAINQTLKNQVDIVDWLLHNAPKSSQSQCLTSFALQAHEFKTKDSGYHRDLAGWCLDGNLFDYHPGEAELSDSMFVTKRTKSHATEYTASSYDMIPEYTPVADTDHAVSGAGAAFHDIPGPQADDTFYVVEYMK